MFYLNLKSRKWERGVEKWSLKTNRYKKTIKHTAKCDRFSLFVRLVCLKRTLTVGSSCGISRFMNNVTLMKRRGKSFGRLVNCDILSSFMLDNSISNKNASDTGSNSSSGPFLQNFIAMYQDKWPTTKNSLTRVERYIMGQPGRVHKLYKATSSQQIIKAWRAP